jgi:hypothetical protein
MAIDEVGEPIYVLAWNALVIFMTMMIAVFTMPLAWMRTLRSPFDHRNFLLNSFFHPTFYSAFRFLTENLTGLVAIYGARHATCDLCVMCGIHQCFFAADCARFFCSDFMSMLL